MAVNQKRGLLQVSTQLQARGAPASGGIAAPSDGSAQAAGAAAAASGSIARDLAGLGQTIGAYADHAVAVEGAAAGKQAGLDPEFRPSGALTIRGEAYDRAGMQVYESTARVEIENDISQGGDLVKKRNAWLSRVPEQLRPEVTHMFRRGELVKSRNEARVHDARVRSESTAALQGEVDSAIKGLHQRGFALGLDAEADKVLATDIALLENTLKRTGANGQLLVAPAKAATLVRQAKEAVTDARLLGAFDRLPSVAAKGKFIERLEDDFAKSKGLAKVYDLGGFQRVTRQLQSGLRQAGIADQQRSAGLMQGINDMERFANQGFAPSADQLAALKARAVTINDPVIDQKLAILEDVASFQSSARQLQPAQLDVYASDLREQISKKGVNDQVVARLKMTEQMAASARKGLKTDALGWADRVQLIELAPIDFSSQETAASGLKQRLVQADAVAKHFAIEPQYLRPEERRRLSMVAAQGGANLMGITAMISEAAGDQAQAVMAELWKDAPTVAMIGGHVVAADGPTAVTSDAADGIALVKTQGFKAIAPPPKDARRLAVAAHEGILSDFPKTEQALITMANMAYEVRARRRGLTDFDDDLWQQTYREAMGERHIDGEAYGGLAFANPGTIWGGSGRVIVPPDVKQDGFADLIRAIKIDDFGEDMPLYNNGMPVSLGDFQKATLKQYGGTGRYALNLGDDETPLWLVGKDGGPFVLDLGKLEPVLRKRQPDAYLGGGPEPEVRPARPPGMMRLGGAPAEPGAVDADKDFDDAVQRNMRDRGISATDENIHKTIDELALARGISLTDKEIEGLMFGILSWSDVSSKRRR